MGQFSAGPIIIYYKFVHVVKNNEKYRRHSKIKGNMQIYNLYQLAAKKIIISHNSSRDKIHPLSLSYQSLHSIKSRINWYIRAWSTVSDSHSVLRQYCLITALTSTVPARNSQKLANCKVVPIFFLRHLTPLLGGFRWNFLMPSKIKN